MEFIHIEFWGFHGTEGFDVDPLVYTPCNIGGNETNILEEPTVLIFRVGRCMQ
jgi:hypothetical protein